MKEINAHFWEDNHNPKPKEKDYTGRLLFLFVVVIFAGCLFMNQDKPNSLKNNSLPIQDDVKIQFVNQIKDTLILNKNENVR
jgi:hypothetical protein